MFDLDGNLKEEHVLGLSYVDTLGNDFVTIHPRADDTLISYRNDYCFGPSFDIDSEGNIFILRQALDKFIVLRIRWNTVSAMGISVPSNAGWTGGWQEWSRRRTDHGRGIRT